MKNFIINKCMSYVKKNNKYSENELKEIKYGLVSIYLTFTKIIVILAISGFLGIFKETLIFMICFNILRTVGFGLHATKSWICWIASIIGFIIIPCISKTLYINIYFLQLTNLLNVLLMFKNSPADTKKRPIVNKKRRIIYKTLSTVFCIIYSFIAVLISNNFITNCLVFSMILENILISPLTYKIFKLPYNNYIDFLKQHPDFTY